ncbi:cold-shock protein [Halalkalibacter flavus]|uniref:cold-shock protein n=1 Tax=Halalkalibacter flavus TaxID=3090668 RepID=UPI002FCC3974
MKGTVKRFNPERGYGFINGENEQIYFVHQTKILMSGFRTLENGQVVSFDAEDTERGLQAINVMPLD